MTNDNIKMNNFLTSLQNMLDSKYILIDRRISDVLLAIAECDEVYNLIAECMINFDFAGEWKKATEGMYFKLPETDAKKIAFVFCMLNNIDDKNIEITKILEKYFAYDLVYSPYELFCKNIVAEFRRLIMGFLGIQFPVVEMDNQPVQQLPEEQQKLITDHFETLANYLRDLVKYLSSLKKLKGSFMPKYDLIAVVSTFEQVVRSRQTEYFYAFLVTINSAVPKNKDIKFMLVEINRLANNLIAKG